MWLVGLLQETIDTNIGMSVKVTSDPEIAGYMLVFKTKKAAKKFVGKRSCFIFELAKSPTTEGSKP